MFNCVRTSAERSPFESCLFAYLVLWNCQNLVGWGRGKCILFVGMLLLILMGCAFFLNFHLNKRTGKHRLMIVQKKTKTHQSLATDLTKNFRELGANWDKYVYFIAPRSLIGNKLGTLSCSLLHQRL